MISANSYLKNIWKDRNNRQFLLLALASSITLFIIFKLLYPYPDFFSDSYSYIEAAYQRLDISIWPIGYSKFLFWVHSITHSDTALIAIQYLLLQLSLMHLFYSIRHFYSISKLSSKILFIIFFINPLSLYLCNYVNSDPLFASLSVFWLVELIWIIKRPRIYQIFTQAVLLFLCFTVRNNAYYYPFVAAAFILFSCQPVSRKIEGILMPLLFIIPFIIHTKNEAYKKTGTHQFSLFTGWQLANNALYIYDKADVTDDDMPTPQSKELNNIAKQYFTHVKSLAFHKYLNSYVGNFFIRQPEAPLKQYYQKYYSSARDSDNVRNWGRASADFEPFGRTVILHCPVSYLQYFVIPNIGHYFLPPLSHLEQYNYGQNKINSIAAYWFDYPTTKVSCVSYGLQQFLIVYVALFALLNVHILWLLLRLILHKLEFHNLTKQPIEYWLFTFFLFLNFIFSVTTTENILRYQFVPLITIAFFSHLVKKSVDQNSVHSTDIEKSNTPENKINSISTI